MTACWCLKKASFLHVDCLRRVHQSIHVYPCHSAQCKVNRTTLNATNNMASFSITATFSRHHTPRTLAQHHFKPCRFLAQRFGVFVRFTDMAPKAGTSVARQRQVRLQEERPRSHSRSPQVLHLVVRGNAKQQLAQQQLKKHSRQDPTVTAARTTSTRSFAGDFHADVGDLFLSNKLSGLDKRGGKPRHLQLVPAVSNARLKRALLADALATSATT